ncbi:MAG: histidinol dehydrogenase [Vallitaleaceae bacterium]|jgi:histidinol dehydrogenase|nr:histidinol dehydrogenase [Vallitaleaceae bacterium]
MKRLDFTKNTVIDIKNLLEERSSSSYESYEKVVKEVLSHVRTKGDTALRRYTKDFDLVDITAETIRVTKEEIVAAYELVDSNLIRVMKLAAQRIKDFHQKQLQKSWFDTDEFGSIMGQKITPVDSVGVYVPGGKNAFPSSVLMNMMPAKVAGVKRIVMTTPPINGGNGQVEPVTLVAADIAGATEIYKVGGAQAIGALAYGTESIKPVTKIVGPGNIYVALAKKAVYGYVGIDSIAGPSEILVIADETGNPEYIAADLLSQAEHDELASSVFITTSGALADQVELAIARQTKTLSRKSIIEASLENYGAIIVVETILDAVGISNQIAPEHLEICVANPFSVLPFITNAGAIFLGEYSPEPLGDYMAGPNHILPTNATAKFFSPLSIDDFIKKSSIIAFNKAGLKNLSEDIMTFASAENLTAHANAIKVRFEGED